MDCACYGSSSSSPCIKLLDSPCNARTGIPLERSCYHFTTSGRTYSASSAHALLSCAACIAWDSPRAGDLAMVMITCENRPPVSLTRQTGPLTIAMRAVRPIAPLTVDFTRRLPRAFGVHHGNMEPTESQRIVMRCWKCHGPLRDETTVDPHSGMSIRQFVCVGCGRRWFSGERPRPAMAA